MAPSGSSRRRASRVRCCDSSASAAAKSTTGTALTGTASRSQPATRRGMGSSIHRPSAGMREKRIRKAKPSVPCTRPIACVQSPRVLKPSMPFNGKRPGASVGRSHIRRPIKTKTSAFPLLMSHARKRCACHVPPQACNFLRRRGMEFYTRSGTACARYISHEITRGFVQGARGVPARKDASRRVPCFARELMGEGALGVVASKRRPVQPPVRLRFGPSND